MQYLTISKNESLQSLTKIVGTQNVDPILAANGLTRSPDIGSQWRAKCEASSRSDMPEIAASRKIALLNNLTGSKDIFEKVCLLDETEWKVFSLHQAFTDGIRIPETIKLPSSSRILGSDERVDNATYRAVMQSLKESSLIDPGIFNTVNTEGSVSITSVVANTENNAQIPFNIPWGKIQIYSSLLDRTLDIPAYPEELETGRQANYGAMPDTIYQYEPWIVYESSGPRTQEMSFHLHRDMWSGNHLDGKANELIRFCEANTFPRYNGSSVLSPTVSIYINGSLFVSGVMLSATTQWGGPIGLDGWYLEFTLNLSIQEVSETALNIDTVSRLPIIGG